MILKSTNQMELTMYTTRNFKSKKELKQAVDAWNDYKAGNGHIDSEAQIGVRTYRPAEPVTYYQPGPFGGNEPRDGVVYIEGPHYPQPHKFYAQCIAKDGVIIKVK
jgi:hypothetical protein